MASFRTTMIALALAVAFAAVASGQDKIPAEAYRHVNEALVANHVVPRYQALAAATGALETAADSFCAAPEKAKLEGLRARFHETMDAWMAVQHLRFGPVELFMRAQRLYFWPEARGRIEDAVRQIVAAADSTALSPDQFRRASVAAQGLPAIEVLLYGEGGGLLLAPGTGGFRCRLLEAASANVHSMAAEIVEGWRGGELDYAAKVIEPGETNLYYRTAREATLDLFKSLHNGLQLIADVKLLQVVGSSKEAAQPRNAESSLSGRALRNIAINLKALQALYLGEGGVGLGDLAREQGSDPELDPLLRRAFDITIATARSIPGELGAAVVDPERRPSVEKLSTQVLALKQIVKTRLSAVLDLSVGFNALDGD
ncbi:MAG: imelysin family protein [Kiloniellales bacterium]